MSESAIHSRLNTEVTVLGGRIYPHTVPQGSEYPAATYGRLDTTRYPAFGAYTDAVEATMEVEVYARRDAGYTAFKTTVDAVRTALQGYGDESLTPPLYDMLIEDEDTDYIDDTLPPLYMASFDIRAWYQET